MGLRVGEDDPWVLSLGRRQQMNFKSASGHGTYTQKCVVPT